MTVIGADTHHEYRGFDGSGCDVEAETDVETAGTSPRYLSALNLMTRQIRSILIASTILLAIPPSALAQEFNCTVSFDLRSISGGSDFSFLEQLKEELREYINTTVWTEDRLRPEERIECSLSVTFLEAISLTRFRANAVITSTRPIYGTSQASRVVTIADDNWIFEHAQGNPVVSNLDRFDELTTFVDYYVYLLLGYDYDTFEELGGTPHFERARRLGDLGKNRGGAGWADVVGERSRTSIVNELLDPRFRELRTAYYRYHYEGLDHFIREPETARDDVLSTLAVIRNLADVNARSYAIDLFFSAKSDELTALFQGSLQSGAAYDLLTEVDPAHLNDYGPLVN